MHQQRRTALWSSRGRRSLTRGGQVERAVSAVYVCRALFSVPCHPARTVGRSEVAIFVDLSRGRTDAGKPAAAAADMASSADQPAAGSQEADADKVELDAAAAYILDVLDQLLLMRGSGAALTEAQLDEWCLAAAALPDGALTALLPGIPPMREFLQMLSDAPADELEAMKSAVLAHPLASRGKPTARQLAKA